MPKKIRLTKAKQAWVDQYKPSAVMKGTTLQNNAGLEAWYVGELEKLVKQMTSEVEKEVKKLFASDAAQVIAVAQDASIASQSRMLMNALSRKFDRLFGRKASDLANRMMYKADGIAKSGMHASLKELSGGLSLKVDIMTAPLGEVIKAGINQNVDYIKSIPAKYLTDVKGAVQRSITTGNGLQDLVPFFAAQEGVTERRARNIARDQTRKALNTIHAERAKAAGIKKFQWIHSGGGKDPRHEHKAKWPSGLNGGIFAFNDLPVIDKRTGERGLPGQAVNCRCTMRPVIEFEEGERV